MNSSSRSRGGRWRSASACRPRVGRVSSTASSVSDASPKTQKPRDLQGFCDAPKRTRTSTRLSRTRPSTLSPGSQLCRHPTLEPKTVSRQRRMRRMAWPGLFSEPFSGTGLAAGIGRAYQVAGAEDDSTPTSSRLGNHLERGGAPRCNSPARPTFCAPPAAGASRRFTVERCRPEEEGPRFRHDPCQPPWEAPSATRAPAQSSRRHPGGERSNVGRMAGSALARWSVAGTLRVGRPSALEPEARSRRRANGAPGALRELPRNGVSFGARRPTKSKSDVVRGPRRRVVAPVTPY